MSERAVRPPTCGSVAAATEARALVAAADARDLQTVAGAIAAAGCPWQCDGALGVDFATARLARSTYDLAVIVAPGAAPDIHSQRWLEAISQWRCRHPQLRVAIASTTVDGNLDAWRQAAPEAVVVPAAQLPHLLCDCKPTGSQPPEPEDGVLERALDLIQAGEAAAGIQATLDWLHATLSCDRVLLAVGDEQVVQWTSLATRQRDERLDRPDAVATCGATDLDGPLPLCTAALSHSDPLRALLAAARVRHALFVPVMATGRRLGTLILHRSTSDCAWSPEAVAIARRATTRCALALRQHELQIQRDCAERQTRAHSNLLGTMSHDLRAPLASIVGFAQMLEQQFYGPLNPKQQEYVSALHGCSQYLLDLTNDLLDLSKLQSGHEEPDLELVAVAEVCDASLDVVRASARDRGLDLDLDIAPDAIACVADRRYLQRILVNLLTNAVKFTEVGSVRVQVRRTERDIAFAVSDTGIGIRTEDLPKLFEPFVQIANAHNRRQRGTGLGLALSKQLAQLHGGDLQVASEVGRGSCFTVSLPVRTLPASGGRGPATDNAFEAA